MRIIYASTSRIPSRAANSIQSMKMCEAFSALGHDVTMIARNGEISAAPHEFYGVKADFEIKYYPWPSVAAGGLVFGGSIYRFLRQVHKDVDLVYARAIYGAMAAVSLGIPTILELHAPPPGRVRRFLEERVFTSRSLVRVIVITGALKTEYRRLFSHTIEQVDIRVAHDGADDEQADGLRPQLAWRGRPGALQVGYIGHLYPGKGAELVHAVAEAMPDVDFHIVGGTPNDVAYWRKQNVLSNLLLHGFVPPSEVSQYRQQFDVLLLPPKRVVAAAGGGGDIAPWMSPLKLFEYMAARKPIVGSDIPVLREVLRHGENCLLADPDLPSAWVNAIRQLGTDVGLREKIADNARREFEERYTWIQRARTVLKPPLAKGGS